VRDLKLIANNKKAFHDYFIEDKFECGIVLKGTEIKSVRAMKVAIKDAYCVVRNQEVFLINMHISKFKEGNIFNHEETRTRKLLLHKKEIAKIDKQVQQQAMTLVPLKVYIEKGLCKVEIALAKGKKNYDKRQSLKEKDMKRRMDQQLNRRY
jgi:SsrA-binding protein